jgi:23S rRNA (pseudouridine1915-N3)-methyltransferase
MKIRLLSVGKPRDASLIRLHDDYADRLKRLGVRYGAEWVADVKSGGRYSDEHVREREAGLLLDRLDSGGTVVALHAAGELLTSEQLGARIERWSTPRLTLVLGGPLGHHPRLLERADQAWSLSPLTFPHELVRVLVAEQLYRAVTLLRRLPYHK